MYGESARGARPSVANRWAVFSLQRGFCRELLGVRVNPRLATDGIKWSSVLKPPFYGGHMAQGVW